MAPRSIARRILGWTGIAVGGLVLVALLLYAAAFAVNLRDEPLTPAARALLEPPPNPYPPDDNVYLSLVGFDAPTGESTVAAGQARIERYDARLAAFERGPTPENLRSLTAEDPRRLRFAGRLDFAPPFTSYWKEMPGHRADVERLLAGNRELCERYRALARQHGYFETAQPGLLSSPLVWVTGAVRTLFLADVVLGMHSADAHTRDRALTDLEADLELWRVVLTGHGTLLPKMLALARLHQDERVLADLIADPDAVLPSDAAGEDALVPVFPLNDFNIGDAYAFEYRAQAALLRQTHHLYQAGWTSPDPFAGTLARWLDPVAVRMAGHFFKLNATLDLFAEQAARHAREAAPGAALPEAALPAGLRTAYNPIGRVLAATSAEVYEYPARAWDEAAFQRLLRVSYEIRRERIAPAGVPAFLHRHRELAEHPVDRRPLEWDSGSGTLAVATLTPPRPGRSYAVRIWRAPPPAS